MEQDKLIAIKPEQITSLLDVLHEILNKGMKSGAYTIEDNVTVIFEQMKIIGNEYNKLRKEFDGLQKAAQHTAIQSKLIDKAEGIH